MDGDRVAASTAGRPNWRRRRLRRDRGWYGGLRRPRRLDCGVRRGGIHVAGCRPATKAHERRAQHARPGPRRASLETSTGCSAQCALEAALGVGDRFIIDKASRLLDPYTGRAVINAGAVMFHGTNRRHPGPPRRHPRRRRYRRNPPRVGLGDLHPAGRLLGGGTGCPAGVR